ncbi:hypothetical protein [Paenibacillus sp. SI8]|uniref:hypothetical protein n=1 Tax=unclassified Paenibacillus TaxID=185978 RepID=UPI00346727D5
MIKNDFELEITNEQLEQFKLTLLNLENDDTIRQLSTKKQAIYRTAVEGEIENLQMQIQQYILLKSGEVSALNANQATDLPKLLINYRIAKGITENEMASLLGVSESELMEHEENLFSDTDPRLIASMVGILKIEVPESLIQFLSNKYARIVTNLKKNIKSLYVSLLPQELKENYNLTDGYLKLYTVIKRVFGDQSDTILFGGIMNSNQLVSVRYKVPKGAKTELVYTYTSYASHIARIVSNTIEAPQLLLTTDPVQFKKDILTKYGEFNLESCVNHIWDLGIPIIPLKIKGGFHGACWRFSGNNVIVLKQQINSSAKWLFDLLHEYWHATQEPDSLERDVVDISETLLRTNDEQEELDANKFAIDVIFDGKSQELLDQCYSIAGKSIANLKNSVIRVAALNKIDLSSLANLVAYDASTKGGNWWGTAQNLQNPDDTFSVVRNILEDKLLLGNINEPLDREFIVNALFE